MTLSSPASGTAVPSTSSLQINLWGAQTHVLIPRKLAKAKLFKGNLNLRLDHLCRDV